MDKTRSNAIKNPTHKLLRKAFGDMEIVDAKTPLKLFPTARDFANGTPRDFTDCGFKRCGARQVGATAALIFRHTSYFDHVDEAGERKIHRYSNSPSVEKEIDKYDRYGSAAVDTSKAFVFLPPGKNTDTRTEAQDGKEASCRASRQGSHCRLEREPAVEANRKRPRAVEGTERAVGRTVLATSENSGGGRDAGSAAASPTPCGARGRNRKEREGGQGSAEALPEQSHTRKTAQPRSPERHRHRPWTARGVVDTKGMTTMFAIKAYGPLSMPDSVVGQYVEMYDPGAFDGRGDAAFTDTLAKAKLFDSVWDALDYVCRVPEQRPQRADGKPNRPLRAFHLEFVQVPNATK